MKKIYLAFVSLAVGALGATAAVNGTIENARPVSFTLTPTQDAHFESNVPVRALQDASTYVGALNSVAAPQAVRATTLDDEEWVSLGNAQYTEDFMTTFFNVDNLTYEVEIQENSATPGFYRLVNPYGAAYAYNEEGDYDTEANYYMYIHAEDPAKVWIEECPMGLDWGYGELSVYSYAGYYLEIGNEAKAAQYYGSLQDGAITFPAKALLVSMAEYNNGASYLANSNGKFRVLLPGQKDYAIDVTAPACAAENKVPFTITAGADVDKAGVCWLHGSYSITEDNVNYLFANANVQKIDPNKTYSLTLSQAGFYTLFVMALDADGNLKGFDGTQLYCYDDNDEDWTSLGTGSFTDDFLASRFTNFSPETLAVEIQVNVATPGYYRVVNPYDNHSSISNYNSHAADHPHYLYINASDPERVFVECTPMGLLVNGNELTFHSMAYNYIQGGKSNAEIDALGVWGTYDEETHSITFPTKTLLSGAVGSTSLSYANTNGAFEVKIPAQPSGVAAVEAETNAPVEYFNLQGMRVDGNAKGLLIKRQGETVTKIVR